MDNQRCPEGYAVVVHSRAEAYPLQGWFERRQSATLRHPTRKQGAGCPSPPRCARGWVPCATTIEYHKEQPESYGAVYDCL